MKYKGIAFAAFFVIYAFFINCLLGVINYIMG